MNTIKKYFLIADRYLNWVSGGSKTNTISGRTGYYANHANTSVRWYWIILQFIIDITFYPLDGLNHCHDSYHRDETLGDYKPTKYVVSFFLLSLFATTSCLILFVPFYLLGFIGIFNGENL